MLTLFLMKLVADSFGLRVVLLARDLLGYWARHISCYVSSCVTREDRQVEIGCSILIWYHMGSK